jgi:hypothetical protein
MNPWTLLKSLYEKTQPDIPYDLDMWVGITMTKMLSQNPAVAAIVSRCSPYMFWLSPRHYYYLLWFTIPRQRCIYHKLPDKSTPIDTQLAKKVQYILGWSNAELRKSMTVIEQTIYQNEQYWCNQLGVDT